MAIHWFSSSCRNPLIWIYIYIYISYRSFSSLSPSCQVRTAFNGVGGNWPPPKGTYLITHTHTHVWLIDAVGSPARIWRQYTRWSWQARFLLASANLAYRTMNQWTRLTMFLHWKDYCNGFPTLVLWVSWYTWIYFLPLCSPCVRWWCTSCKHEGLGELAIHHKLANRGPEFDLDRMAARSRLSGAIPGCYMCIYIYV